MQAMTVNTLENIIGFIEGLSSPITTHEYFRSEIASRPCTRQNSSLSLFLPDPNSFIRFLLWDPKQRNRVNNRKTACKDQHKSIENA